MLKTRFPDLRWHMFEPAEDDDTEPARAVYGQPLKLRPRLMDAAVVLAFDADPLGPGPDQAANARALASRRGGAPASTRLYQRRMRHDAHRRLCRQEDSGAP